MKWLAIIALLVLTGTAQADERLMLGQQVVSELYFCTTQEAIEDAAIVAEERGKEESLNIISSSKDCGFLLAAFIPQRVVRTLTSVPNHPDEDGFVVELELLALMTNEGRTITPDKKTLIYAIAYRKKPTGA